MGERLLGDVHKPLRRRATKEGGIHQPAGSEGSGRGIQEPLQRRAAAQRFGLPDTGGVCGIMRAGERRRRRPHEGARIGNHTLIVVGTENGVRLAI